MEEANPNLTPDQTLEILTATANPMPYEEFEAGSGYLDAYDATTQAGGQQAAAPRAKKADKEVGARGKGPGGKR